MEKTGAREINLTVQSNNTFYPQITSILNPILRYTI